MPFLLKLGDLNLKRVLSFIVAFVSFLPLFAQTVSVEAKLDSIAISIGQQAHLSVSVTSPKGAHENGLSCTSFGGKNLSACKVSTSTVKTLSANELDL